MSADPYAALELQCDATDAEIKAAYRRLAALYHPDRNPGFQAAATERLKQLNQAVEVIGRARRAAASAGTSSAPPNSEPRPTPHAGRADAKRSRSENQKAKEEAQGRAERENGEEVRQRALLSSIAASLARVGYLNSAAAGEGDPVVEILAAVLPPKSDIALCMRLRPTGAASPHGTSGSGRPASYRERSLRILRALPPDFGAPFGLGSPQDGRIAMMAHTHVVVCTGDLLLWTRATFGSGDGVLIEERVTVYTIPFSALLGTTLDRKSIIKIWVDDGPTLKLQLTNRDDAAALFAYVDRASAEA